MEPIYWLVALAVLLIVEIATLGLTTIWFAGGALVAFIASLAGANLTVQLVLFLAVSFAMLFSIRPYAAKFFNNKRTKTNYESLIGAEAKVTSEIDNFNQMGTAMINGLEWTARAEKDQIIPAGTKVEIVEVAGVKLIVREKKEEVAHVVS